MKHLLKKAFLLLALVGGTNSAWGQDMELKFTSSDAVSDATSSKVYCTYFTVGASDSKKISIASSNKTIDGKSFTYTLKFGGTGDASGRYVKFSVTGPCTIKAYGASAKDKTERYMVLASGSVGGTVLVSEMCKNSGTPSAESYSYTGEAADLYIYSGNSGYNLYGIDVTYPAKTATSEVLKSSSAVKVGETTLTKDAGTNGYSVDETTITLSNDITALSAPANVKLVKTITYDDSSTEDKDVVVTFDGTVTAGYYIGTASIGLVGSVTDYTVKVKKNVTPTAELTATSGTISMANSYTVIGSKTVTLTGGNLTDGEYEVTADQSGTTISPSSFTIADGSVSQEFTITTSGSSAATTVFTFGTSAMGVAAPTYTLTYETVAKRSLSQSDVSAATTWDWTKAGSNTVELTDKTGPTMSDIFLMASLPEVNNDAYFNSQALMIQAQFPTRGTYYNFQGYSIKFNATVPGTIDVTFSNTGGSRPYRYLRVNGTQTSYKSGTTEMVEATGIAVPAGEVVIDFYIPDASDPTTRDDDVVGTTMCRVRKIVFTPGAKLNASGYATFSAGTDMHIVSGATAYKATLDFAYNLIACEEIADGNIPAGAGVLLYGDANEQVVMTSATGIAALTDNDLKGTTKSDGTLAEKVGGHDYYALSGNTFMEYSGAAFVHNKAYFEVEGGNVLARPMTISFDGLTGVDKVENGEAKSSLPVKRIVNGNLVIEKGGQMFNANGQLVK